MDNAIEAIVERFGGETGDTGYCFDEHGAGERDVSVVFPRALPDRQKHEMVAEITALGCAYVGWD